MPTGDPAHRLLYAWANDHAGTFTREQAMACGLTQHQFRRGVTQRNWTRYRGCWILAGSPDSEAARLWSALLRSGSWAAITGPTALRLHGLDAEPGPPRGSRFSLAAESVYLSVPTGFHGQIPGVVYLREVRFPKIVEAMGNLAVVPANRAVIDTIRLLGWQRSQPVMYRALQRGWVTPSDITNATIELKGCRGNRELRRAAVAANSGSHAESERLAQRILRNAGLRAFTANLEVHDQFGLIGFVDLAFSAEKVAIEVDGLAWHSDARRFQHDRTRQNRLVNARWTVLRFTWNDLKDRPDYVVQAVRTALTSSRR